MSKTYSAGLRINELVILPMKAIDSDRMQLPAQNFKGNKDRKILLSKKQLEFTRIYFKKQKPSHWLYEGMVSVKEKSER